MIPQQQMQQQSNSSTGQNIQYKGKPIVMPTSPATNIASKNYTNKNDFIDTEMPNDLFEVDGSVGYKQ